MGKGGDVHKIINEKGCLVAGEEWLERNLLVVAGIAVGVAFLQVRSFRDLAFFSLPTRGPGSRLLFYDFEDG